MKSYESNDTESKKRKTWKRNFDFVLNMMGMMIGLGNVWRFPYLCYKNGGGAFLIPYLVVILLVAWPLIVLESAIGQKCGRSAVTAWSIMPIARGIGYASPILMLLANIFYPLVLTWALRWFVASFSSTMPWTSCNNTWNTENCITTFITHLNESETSNGSKSEMISNQSQSSVEEFWKRHILAITPGMEEVGGIKWDLFGCLLAIWIMVYFSVWKGIGWTSKIVYVTATLPLAMMVVVAVRGFTLEGADQGIEYYLKPNMTKLLEIQIWSDAAAQVMYSCCVAVGLVSTLSGYNRYNHNFFRDSIILVVSNSCASFLAGLGIFSVLGYLAHAQNKSIDDVAESGPGLVFTAYPTALSLLPLPQLWSAFFFLMIIFLGFDGQFVVQETLMSCMKDLFPRLFNRKWGRELVVAVSCVTMFLPGIAMVTRGGMYVFYILDQYAISGWCIFFIGLCQFLVAGWLYGADRLCDDINDMIGVWIPRFWLKFCWKFAGPLITITIMIYSLVQYKPMVYDRTYVYPTWANVLGWCIALSSMLWLPGTAVYSVWTAKGNGLKEKLKAAVKSPEDLGKKGEEVDLEQAETKLELEKMLEAKTDKSLL